MQTRLRWGAAFLAAFWAVFMTLSSPEPRGLPSAFIFSIGGVFVGVLWYAAMKRFVAWHAARQANS